ncbi:MAG: hypothetical protein ACYSSK_05375, partial [Planctomycetota bacterium]
MLFSPDSIQKTPDSGQNYRFHALANAAKLRLKVVLQMILQTFAAYTLTTASGITAGTEVHVFVFFAFHSIVLSVLSPIGRLAPLRCCLSRSQFGADGFSQAGQNRILISVHDFVP